MSFHGVGFTGGMNLFVPAVVAPYGIPLKTLMPSSTTPRTFPADVAATTVSASANAMSSQGAAYAPAINSDACRTNVLRAAL
jgi:hypothetical protein